jgi:hypothetical protein
MYIYNMSIRSSISSSSSSSRKGTLEYITSPKHAMPDLV